MTTFPDFTAHGYEVTKEIGFNRSGGRVTYQAKQLETGQMVAIKQFQFAKVGTNWSQYDCYQQEVQVLRGLNHPGIPRYLESFQTDDGFCMVQEYKHAVPLSVPRSFDPEDVKQIAIAVLEILVYLQNRIPPVIHRDIKPENILVDDAINVFLVDFGFARIGDGEVAVSSVVKGTMGFMPPEQLFNRELTEASDLYGLGAMLICLLTQTKSVDVGSLLDLDHRFHFKHLVPKLNLRWVKWLEKMVEPRPKDRFPNALTALEALRSIPVTPLPEVQLGSSSVTLKAPAMGAKITERITVKNPIATRLPLEGRWEVAAHTSDPPHTPDAHAWIRFEPATFVGNETECTITVDTSKLRAESLYQRRILLHTNSQPKTYSLDLKLQTAALPVRQYRCPYEWIGLLLLLSVPIIWVGIWLLRIIGEFAGNTIDYYSTLVLSSGIGFVIIATILAALGMKTGAIANTIVSSSITLLLVGALVGSESEMIFNQSLNLASSASIIGSLVGVIVAAITGLLLGSTAEYLTLKQCSRRFAIVIALVTIAFGSTLALGNILGFFNPWVFSGLLVTGGTFIGLLTYQLLTHIRQVSQYRRSERFLIKP
ncbi:MAG: protein kinase [Leptolyngbyaceae cyanobacterium bins.302]|nr:protein kinase [Leptolyngbyaceae cyanobacterium bins.302]